MRPRWLWGALSVVLISAWGPARATPACPRPCACYVPSEVHCTFRSLAAVPAGIAPRVERINLGFNSIRTVSGASFAGLTRLELLLLHGNDIPAIPDGALQDLGSLQVLKLSYNKLRVVTGQTLRGLPRLVRLHLDHNQIEFIHPRAFQGLLSLRLLHLEGNALRQLHPETLATFTFLGSFGLSTLRHLYLAENRLQRLPPGALPGLPLLENLYLQDNPWACDCQLAGLLRWSAHNPGVLKCRKDKAYEGGQWCPACASPSSLQKRELAKLSDAHCGKPTIESSLRANRTGVNQEDPDSVLDPGAGDADDPLSLAEPSRPWHVSLNMTDEHGNGVFLVCGIKAPGELRHVQLNHTDRPEVGVRATVALDFECPVTRKDYEDLWRLIAYYSEVPVTLHREPMPDGDAGTGHGYRQDAEDQDALYYTGVKAWMDAEPRWVLQPILDIRFDRRQSTASHVLLAYSAQFSQNVTIQDTRPGLTRSWVMIEPTGAVQTTQMVLEGAPCQLSCEVKASESPAISWVLPDGSVLTAPLNDPDGRFSILSSGWLKIKSAQLADSGLYRCVARVSDAADSMAYRVVVAARTPGRPMVTVEGDAGDPMVLPCQALAVPEAHLSWVLPNRKVVDASTNASHAYVLANGSLSIPSLQGSHEGPYRCVAANLHGVDQLTMGIMVRRKGSGRSAKRLRQPSAKALSRGEVVGPDRGSGEGGAEIPSGVNLHPKDQEIFLHTEGEVVVTGGKRPRKGRRKLKVWKDPEKEPETNMAEGRRGFESRRRINVANKQIHPERWADILARVRGKNPPKGSRGPPAGDTTTRPPESSERTRLSPAAPPPSMLSELVAPRVEEASADVSMFDEEDQDVRSTQPSHLGGTVAWSHVDNNEEQASNSDILETTEDTSPMEGELKWVQVTSPGPEPDTSSSSLGTVDSIYQDLTDQEPTSEPSWTVEDVGSLLGPTAKEEEPPLGAVALAESKREPFFDLRVGTSPQPDLGSSSEPLLIEDSTVWAEGSETSESLPHQPLGEEDISTTQSRLQGPRDSSRQVVKSQRSSQRPAMIKKKSRGRLVPAQPLPRDQQDTASPSQSSPSLATLGSISLSWEPGTTTCGSPLDRVAATASTVTPSSQARSTWVPATPPSRGRGGGRRRFRPNKPRRRQKLTPLTTVHPLEISSESPTYVPDVSKSSPVPVSRGDVTVRNPKQLAGGIPTHPTSRGPSRRKNGKRTHKHRHNSVTASSEASTPRISPEYQDKHGFSLTEPPPSSGTGPLKTRDSYGASAWEDYGTTTPNMPSPPSEVHKATPVEYQPMLWGQGRTEYDVTGADEYRTHTVLLTESMTQFSTSSSWVSAVGGLNAESPRVTLPGTPTWSPPRTSEPPLGQTDSPVTRLGEDLTQTSLSKELEGTAAPPNIPPSTAASSPALQRDVDPPDTSATVTTQLSSSDPETTTLAQHHHEVTRVHATPEMMAQTPTPTPTWVEEQDPQFAPATSESLVRTTQPPTPDAAPSTPPGAPTDANENSLLNFLGSPHPRAPPEKDDVAPQEWGPRERPIPSSTHNSVHLSSKLELAKEVFGGRPAIGLPRGPQDGSVHPAEMSARETVQPVPPRGTGRPPSAATQRPSRYLVTMQSPHYVTSKPEITAFPSRVLPERNLFVTSKLWSVTTAPASHMSKLAVPSSWVDPGKDPPDVYSKTFGNNIPEPRNPAVAEFPKLRVPHYSHGRFPFWANRTLSFPQLVVPMKPQASASPAPGTREGKFDPGRVHKFDSQSSSYLDLGPPAPPWPYPHGAPAPPSTHFQRTPWVHSTPSSRPFITPPSWASGGFLPSNSKVFAGGPPAPKFESLGDKPRILSKFPKTVSIPADSDVMLPCEAAGNPTPFITWTKVSTGALMTPNTRTPRFEVLKNGTLLIRKAQVQDRGHYLCTASNPRGVDKVLVPLSVAVQPPQIVASRFQDVTVYLGDTVAMECLARGTPAPTISWISPDRRVWHGVSPSAAEGRVALHENHTLSIRNASFGDAGVYRCVASSAAGADSLALRLHVAALPPLIRQEPAENVSAPAGVSVHVHCSATGAPAPTLRWVLPDGSPVRPSQFLRGKLFVFPNGTLLIRQLAPRDGGRYQCVASNPVGSARRSIRLAVQRPGAAQARITGASPRRTDVRYGGTLRLHCSASGDPWPRILWRLPSKHVIDMDFSSGARVQAFPNGTLVVDSVTDGDAGDYMCVARNKVGDDSVVLRVNVLMQPAKIEFKQDHDHQVSDGGDLRVDCVASGLPDPEISWSLPDGSTINSVMQADDSGGRAQRYVVFHNGTLYVNEVGPGEAGHYTCVAENQLGKDQMQVRVKVVAERATIRDKTVASVSVAYGDVATVPCRAKGEPVPRVMWLSPTNKVIPASSEKYQVSPDGTLLIRKTQRSDSGNYTCLARNSAGEDRKMVWLHVHVQPPRINGHPDATSTVQEVAAAGTRKVIPCRAEGIPTPRVLWAFPEGVVLPAPYYGHRVTVHPNGTLDIRSVRKSDAVQLVCIARSPGGEARRTVRLRVLDAGDKPTFHDPMSENITATAGHTISLNCSAQGTPPPSLVWRLPNGTELQSGQHLHRFYHKEDGMLHISGLAAVDAGPYRCLARNPAGHAERLVSLKVGLRPETGSQYRNLVSIMNGETLQLHCGTQGGQRGRVSWTLPSGVSLEGPQARGRFSLLDNGTLTVHEASVFDRGTYTCRTEAEQGSSVTSVPVIVIAYPPRITSELTPVIYTRAGGTLSIHCMAMGSPRAEVSWELPDRSRLMAGTRARVYGNRVLNPQGSLTVQQVTQKDAGFYRCVAKNILGTDSKTTYVHVY
ncbi:matrix-remodeling-associated protein 5 [Ctenodactylus gundi]